MGEKMTEETKKIKEALNKIYIDRDSYNKLCKDRCDFGFDSIYFRYAIIRDELAYYKATYERHINSYETERKKAECDKMHFYNALEQLTLAHEGGVKE